MPAMEAWLVPGLRALALLGIGLSLGRLLANHLLTWRHLARLRREQAALPAACPPVSVLKPVRGIDQSAETNYTSFFHLAYPAPYEVLFCVEDEDDPAVPLIEKVRRAHPDVPSRLIVSRRDPGWLGKAANLIAGVEASRYEALALSDSDVRASPDLLTVLVRPLADPKVGLSFGCPAYREPRNWVAALMALAVNESMTGVVSRFALGRRDVGIGATMVLRRAALQAIGGLEPLANRVGLDASLGRAVARAGYVVALIPEPVPIIHHHDTFGHWWRHLHRWLVTIRCYLPRLYALGIIAEAGLPCAGLLVLLGPRRVGVTLVGVVVLARMASGWAVNRWFTRDPQVGRWLWLAPVLDLLRIPLWLHGYLSRQVPWRGRWLVVRRDGTAVERDAARG